MGKSLQITVNWDSLEAGVKKGHISHGEGKERVKELERKLTFKPRAYYTLRNVP